MNTLKTFLLLGVLSAILVSIGAQMGPGMMVLFAGLALLLNAVAYFYSDRLVLRMHGARPLPREEAPALHEMVDTLSARAGIPVPRLFLIADAQPNAFATGRNPEHGVVAVTEGLLRLLPPRELAGVVAHEIAHIRNRDILIASVAAAIATAVSFVGNALQWSAIFGGRDDEEGGSPFGALALAIVAPIAATLVQLGISRAREYVADATAAELTGDAEGLAGALARLEVGVAQVPPASAQTATASLFIANPFARAGGLTRLFSTHPPMADRIARLRARPVVGAAATGLRPLARM
ncbi:MAG: M48 family metalloprotease [Vicinamibacterales bacterium]